MTGHSLVKIKYNTFILFRNKINVTFSINIKNNFDFKFIKNNKILNTKWRRSLDIVQYIIIQGFEARIQKSSE